MRMKAAHAPTGLQSHDTPLGRVMMSRCDSTAWRMFTATHAQCTTLSVVFLPKHTFSFFFSSFLFNFFKETQYRCGPLSLNQLSFSLFTELRTRTSRNQRGQRSQRTRRQSGKKTMALIACVCVCVCACVCVMWKDEQSYLNKTCMKTCSPCPQTLRFHTFTTFWLYHSSPSSSSPFPLLSISPLVYVSAACVCVCVCVSPCVCLSDIFWDHFTVSLLWLPTEQNNVTL